MKRFFCVYPHCLVRTNDEEVMVFNPRTKEILFSEEVELVESFSQTDSFVFPVVEHKSEFYTEALSKQLGYIVNAETQPYYASPNINFVSSMTKEQRALGYSSGWRVPSLIKSISIYLNNKNIILTKELLYAQLEYPKYSAEIGCMSQRGWDKLRTVLVCSPIETVYICGDIDDALLKLLDKVRGIYAQNVIIRTSTSEYDKAIKLLDATSNISIDFIVNDFSLFERIAKSNDVSEHISFTIPIFSLKDLPQIDVHKLSMRYVPLVYDVNQQKDLIEQMLLSYNDIIESTDSIDTCLTRDIVNANFWGYITICQDGTLSIGNIEIGDLNKNGIYSLMVNYLQSSDNLWMFSRNKYLPCQNCIYTSICPNVSIYERQGVIKRACCFAYETLSHSRFSK